MRSSGEVDWHDVTSDVITDVQQLLSAPRLTPYRQATGGDLPDALTLYTLNVQISGAFYESLHYFEVGLRNRLDQQLTAWATTLDLASPGAAGSRDNALPSEGRRDVAVGPTSAGELPWYRHPQVPLSLNARRKVATAIKAATRDGREELPGRVVAELTFGFWWSLLADEYNRSLWQPCLREAFTQVRRQRLHSTVDELRQLRNRIAHHEPIHGRDLHHDYDQLLATAGRITPRLHWLIDTTSRVPALLPTR
ncbi:hypothetical protein F1544_20635 [Kineosporiaceae bacterium B12]|nr:hypothetical protein [Kineococcus rubinsiae]